LTLRAQRDRSIVLLGFALGARRSELASLTMSDIRECPEGLRVLVLRAKTQAAPAEIPVPWASDRALCPVRTILDYVAALQTRSISNGPLFVRITRTDAPLAAGLTGASIGNVVTKLAARAGVEVPAGFAGYTGHSLRRGFATEARRAGADPLRIARQAGWADNSASLARYLADVDRWTNHPLDGVL
jgi:integrase